MSTPEEIIASDALDITNCFVQTAQFALVDFFKTHRVASDLLENLTQEDTDHGLDKFQTTYATLISHGMHQSVTNLILCVQKTLKYIETFPEWQEEETPGGILVPTNIFAETTYHDLLKELLFEAVTLEHALRSYGITIIEPEAT